MTDHILSLHKQLNKVDRLSDMISLMDVMPDNKTIFTRENAAVQVLKLEGKDYGGVSNQEMLDLYSKRKGFFENLNPNLSISIHYHRIKYDMDSRAYELGSEYANEIVALHDSKFTSGYRTDIYLVVTKKDSRALSKTGLPSKNRTKEIEHYLIEARQLSDEVETITAMLEDYKPQQLFHKADGKSPLLNFWMYLLNAGQPCNLTPTQSNDLNNAMALSDIQVVSQKKDNLFRKLNKIFKEHDVDEDASKVINSTISNTYDRFDADYIITHTETGKRYTAFVAMKSYPDETASTIFDGLMAVQANFVMIQHIEMLHEDKVKADIEMKVNRWGTIGKFSSRVIEDLVDCNNEVQAGTFQIGKHNLSLAVHGENKEECERSVRLIQQAFNSAYINSIRERMQTEHAFWSQFPDYSTMNDPRGGKISSNNMANMVSFSSREHGNQSCSFGDAPVTYFKTPDGQNYSFTFHPDEEKYSAGHTMVFGSTGSGKTVLMNFLAMNCLKYTGEGKDQPLRQIIFDSLSGMKIPINAFGGEYIDFLKDEVNLNPLHMPKTEMNLRFLREWISNLAGEVSEEEANTIKLAIDRAYKMKKENRSLNEIRDLFGIESFVGENNEGATLAARLSKWMPDRESNETDKNSQGSYFNHKTDALSFDKRVVGFDMAPIKEDEELLPILTSYIFHRFLQEVKDKPTPHICIMDEAIDFMNNDIMYPFIERFLREQRKLDGVFIGAVQSPSLIMGNNKIEELLSHIKTYIIYPDMSAVREDYIGSDTKKGLGLTESEFKWVRSKKPSREVMIKRSTGESVILDVDLSGLGKHLTLLRSETSLVKDFEEISDDYKKQLEIAKKQKTKLPTPWQEQLMEKAK